MKTAQKIFLLYSSERIKTGGKVGRKIDTFKFLVVINTSVFIIKAQQHSRHSGELEPCLLSQECGFESRTSVSVAEWHSESVLGS